VCKFPNAIFCVLFAFLPLFARIIQIKTSVPYSSGQVWANPGTIYSINSADTILFSNGVQLHFCRLNSGRGIPEPTTQYFSIAFHEGTFLELGYKNGDSLKRVGYPSELLSFGATITTKNADTVWESATTYHNYPFHYPPIFPIDTVLANNKDNQQAIDSFKGKWLFRQYTGIEPWQAWFVHSIENCNSIIYLMAKSGSTMKMQFRSYKSSIKYCYPSGGYCNDIVDSVLFYWATDSYGDGKYMPTNTQRNAFWHPNQSDSAPKIAINYLGRPLLRIIQNNIQFNVNGSIIIYTNKAQARPTL
jgi:hypothetical protein